MKRVIVLYGKPASPDAFEKHYLDIHVPLVKRMPHLKGFEYSRGAVAASSPEGGWHFVAILTYASQADLDASLASPEGQAAVADVANFATGGAQILTVETVAAL